MSRVLWLLLVLAALCFGNSGLCLAEPQCPWMNAATAGGFLGGEAKAAVTGVTVEGDATCAFKVGTGSMLRIAVHTMTHTPEEFPRYLALCGGGSASLKGIGNEASQCMPKAGESKGEELIVGRVRDRVFVISIKADWITQPPSNPTKTRNPISDDSENIAEQVAGSMF